MRAFLTIASRWILTRRSVTTLVISTCALLVTSTNYRFAVCDGSKLVSRLGNITLTKLEPQLVFIVHVILRFIDVVAVTENFLKSNCNS